MSMGNVSGMPCIIIVINFMNMVITAYVCKIEVWRVWCEDRRPHSWLATLYDAN